jgi:hypothetical protein
VAKLSSCRLFLVPTVTLFLLGCEPGEPGEPKQHVTLASSVVLPSEVWFEVASTEPLRTPSYIHQVCFDVVPPLSLADAAPMGVVDESGKNVSIQVKVSGEGTDVDLPLQNYYGNSTICYGIAEVGLDRTFDKVRIYTSEELSIEELRWNSTDK